MANFFSRILGGSPFSTSEERKELDTPQATRSIQTRGAFLAASNNRLTLDWSTTLQSADDEVYSGIAALRARSRDLCRNNPYAARFLELLGVYVVGSSGIQLHARIRDAKDEMDDTTNLKIQSAWTDWGRNPTIDGRMTWTDLQQLVIKTVAQDGEVFVRIFRNVKKNKYGVAVQTIDADFLDHTFNGGLRNGNEVIQGIEVDSQGQPVAYHFWTSHPNKQSARQRGRIRIPAKEIIHLYRPSRINQTRGVPWTTPAMFQLKMLDELMIAELVATRTAAAKMGFIQDAPTDASIYSDEELESALPQEYMSAQPGSIARLNPGEQFVAWNPDHPTTAFSDFTKLILRGIASSFNVSYSSLASDVSQESYSSGRIGSVLERDHWRNLQGWLAATLHDRVYDVWIDVVALNGSAGLKSKNGDDYKNVAWRYRGFRWIDPQKDLTAYEKAINLGLMSRTMIAAEMGLDVREILADLDKENQMAEEYQVDIDGVVQNTIAAEQQSQNNTQ